MANLAQLLSGAVRPSENLQTVPRWRSFFANELANVPNIEQWPEPGPPLPGAFGQLGRSMDDYSVRALAEQQARGGGPRHHYVFPMPYEDEYDPTNLPPAPHR